MRRTVFIVILILLIFSFASMIMAQDSASDLQKKIQEYQAKLNDLRSEKNTLSSQIQYMDTQIYLTGLKIEETQKKIETTQKEIDLLGTRIDSLDSSLNHLSKVLLERVVDGYKKGNVSFLEVFLGSSNADDLINQIKYEKTAQNNNQKLLINVQETKLNFEEQKKLREDKQIQLAALTDQLNQQNDALESEKTQKENLLADTQNSETVYQQLLSQAQAQLSAFKSFVVSTGAGIISANQFGNGSDGNYFSQRDARWASNGIGYSSENILNVGCLLTSVAMTLKKNGVSIDPAGVAGNTNYFYLNTAFMKYRTDITWPNGLHGHSGVNVDSELQSGHYVIAGINYGSCYDSNGNLKTSDHFVVIIKKDGNNYIMHDPIYGPDTKFYDHYSAICTAETIY